MVTLTYKIIFALLGAVALIATSLTIAVFATLHYKRKEFETDI